MLPRHLSLPDVDDRLGALVANIPGLVYRCADDADCAPEVVSDGVEALTGYPASDYLSGVRPLSDLKHPEDRDRVVREVHGAIERREAFDLEYRCLHADGTVRWLHERGRPVFSADGKLLYLDGVALDVTARKQAEEALRTMLGECSAILEHMSEGLMVADATGRIIVSNAAAAELLGPEAQLWPMFAADGSVLTAGERPIARTLRGEDANGEYRVVRPDGGERWVLISASTLRDGARVLTGALVVARDTTERHRAAGELSQREQMLRLILDTMPDCVKLTDRDGRVVQMNRAGLAMLEATAEQVIGQMACSFVDPVDHINLARAAELVFAGGTAAGEFTITGLSGRRRRVEAISVPFRGTGGAVEAVLTVTRDVTEQRAATSERSQRAAQLAETAKMRALGQMAGGIVHDLSQSLGMVAAYGDLARTALVQMPPDLRIVREAVEVTTQAAHDGGRTVRQLLAFARQRDAVEVMEPVNVRALLEDTARLTAPRWRDAAQEEGRPIALTIHAAGDLVVSGSAAELREALTNLVFNAVDALPGGGTIQLTAIRAANGIAFQVVDDGEGMPEAVRARVFEPFFTTKGERGTGLGLAQVFATVDRHGGAVAVQSSLGQGTTVRVELPARAIEERTPRDADSPAVAAQRVLVVDDEQALARATMLLLRQHGHEAVATTSARKALRWLERQPFDVLVSDLSLGDGMNGWQLVAEARRRHPGLRAVLATGWGAAIAPSDAEAAGVAAVVTKPFRVRELLRAFAAGPAAASTKGIVERVVVQRA